MEFKTPTSLPAFVLPSRPLWLMPNQPKALVISEGYHTNINVNRMAKWLVGNIGEYAGGGSMTAQWR